MVKAVLLAGGLGARREETEFRPKSTVEVGGRPVLWHIMKALGSLGLTESVVCTGHKGNQIADYFANYTRLSKDFTVRLGDAASVMYHGDVGDEASWMVTVAHTGVGTMTGGRVKRIREYIGNEPFFCTYGDPIADVDVRALIKFDIDAYDRVAQFRVKPLADDWVNIGYSIFQPEVFEYIEGDDTVLEQEHLLKLAADGQLATFKHKGFWQPMDTYREAQHLNDLWAKGAPWKTWE